MPPTIKPIHPISELNQPFRPAVIQRDEPDDVPKDEDPDEEDEFEEGLSG